MAIQNLRGVYYPEPLSATNYTAANLVSTSDRFAMVFQAADSGSLTQVGIRTLVVTATAALRVRIETLDSSGIPTGTLVAAGAEGSIASPASNTWYEVTLTTPLTVSRGDRITIVVDAPVGTPNLTMARLGSAVAPALPYTASFTASAWAKSTVSPCASAKINGAWSFSPSVWPISNLGSTTFSSSSTPDERGNRFTLPFKCRAEGVWIGTTGTSSTGAVSVVLYDLSNNIVASGSLPAGADAGVNNSPKLILFSSEVELAANFEGRVTLLPTTTTTVVIRSATVPSTDYWVAVSGGARFWRTTRTDAGVWTDTTTSRENIGLVLSGIDDGLGTGRYKTKVGGSLVNLL